MSGAAAALLRQVVLYLPTLLAIATIVFLLPRLMPGDPLLARLDPESSLYLGDPDAYDRLVAYYGLDRPLPDQYLHYLTSLAQGDLGWSIVSGRPVTEVLGERLPWTLLLVGTALVLSSVISFLAGVAAAWRRGRARDRVLLVTTTGLRAVPEYVSATLLLIGFAVLVPVFPLAGARTPFADYGSPLDAVTDVAYHLALPATALTASLIAGKFLLVRNTMISALGEDYMLLARAKGLPERVLKYRHAARNSLLPFLTVLGIQSGFAVSGAIFVESIFAYPGMGSLTLEAVQTRDYPVLEGCFLTLAATVLLVNALIDLAYVRLDPRARAVR